MIKLTRGNLACYISVVNPEISRVHVHVHVLEVSLRISADCIENKKIDTVLLNVILRTCYWFVIVIFY